MTKLINSNGVSVEYQNVPDCWHAYMWLKENAPTVGMGDGISLADMVLDCWHQAHDYKAALLGEDKAQLVIESDNRLLNKWNSLRAADKRVIKFNLAALSIMIYSIVIIEIARAYGC